MKKRKKMNDLAHAIFLLCTLAGIMILFILIYDISKDGFRWLTKVFFENFPSRFPDQSGIKPALYGSMWIIGFTALFSIPVGIGAAIYLEEYAKNNWFKKLIVINIANLAGVPSIVYGMLGLTIFVRTLGFGRSILSGALTMSLLVLPIIIVASQEAIRTVSIAMKAGSYALGATKWQTITKIVVPTALPGMLTGIIFAISRALGETAPLLMVGAFSYISTLPKGPMDSFIVLPIQIYMWAGRPQADFRGIAAAAIIVLLALLLTSNGLAILLRNKYQVRSEE
ncbi:phosphate ABC transporter permease PstA [Cellulosilyticum sp. I15G10I2]|uniref:phosphate ABC transporter permease PstA n=1 Tax=Cellulosilyticum sp. I15G10I2 TaxID=1892843 RepID=UPI00085BEE79|nr:phosphate ABC transporter permease PstA [Cellulosilyticum sp. I15G10I2]